MAVGGEEKISQVRLGRFGALLDRVDVEYDDGAEAKVWDKLATLESVQSWITYL